MEPVILFPHICITFGNTFNESCIIFAYKSIFLYIIIKESKCLYMPLLKYISMKSVYFVLEDELIEPLKQYTKDHGCSKKWLFNKLIKEFLQENGYLK